MTQQVEVREALPEKGVRRRGNRTFYHALAFVVGFSVVFVLLGLAAGLLGQGLSRYLPLIQRVGALLLVVFALTTLGVFRRLVAYISGHSDLEQNRLAAVTVSALRFFDSLLYTEKRVTGMHQVNRGWGYFSSIFMGMSFSAGWVPCVGPILASILFIASDSATATTGAFLLFFYSLGLGIPFLITGAAFGRATSLLHRLNRHAGIVSIVSGLFLLYVAYVLWFDQLSLLAGNFAFLNAAVYQMEEAVTGSLGLSGQVSALGSSVILGAPLAVFAGLISFLSPCVLPLIPAYIGYLSGTSMSETR
ncbi:MAG: sulfite exporter TauE/SafE family protein [Caldilineaceae bacterium]|nr:sulfite exporter TauE/SafE family protein [Caldilineaceae bacterium]